MHIDIAHIAHFVILWLLTGLAATKLFRQQVPILKTWSIASVLMNVALFLGGPITLAAFLWVCAK